MNRKLKEKNISYKTKILILAIFPLFCLIYPLILGQNSLILGLVKILNYQSILITDYMDVGGFYSNLLNIGIVSLINLIIIYTFKIPINGIIFSAFFLSIGFSSFGKNFLNIIPIYLGGFLYSKYEKIEFKNIFGILIFSTCLSPITSYFIFHTNLFWITGLFLGILCGIIIGFITPTLSAHMIKFHDGFNLYNIGFTAGIIGTIFTSVVRGKNIPLEGFYFLSSEYDFHIKIILSALFSIYIFIGYYINNYTFEGYDQLLSSTGRLVTDYILSEGFGITLINAGILGLLGISLPSLIGTPLNGPLVAGIFTLFGFGAFGKNPLNCLPVIIGVLIAGFFNLWGTNNFNLVLAALFGTTLAPISGTYGPIAGIIAGFLHLHVVNNIGIVHGGVNLYNNGFSGGIVAGVLAPLINKFKLGAKK